MQHTALIETHRQLGGRLVDFAGWEMPVQYTSIVEEHTAVRERAGLFDLGHMGRLSLSGDGVTAALDRLVPADLTRLAPGQAKYTFFLTPEGTFIDDILVYAETGGTWYLVVNASNREACLAHLAAEAPGVTVVDRTHQQAMIAVQGPQALARIDALAGSSEASALGYYHFADMAVAGVTMRVARCGYTGEDGVELYLPAAAAGEVWSKLAAGDGVCACGLGARDTLRLEAAMSLYGHEIDRETNPVEARLSWAVAWDKAADYLGRAAIEQVKADGPTRRLVGLVVNSKRVPRQGQPICHEGRPVGHVTSGTVSPTLDQRIAMGYVEAGLTKAGTALTIDVRGHQEPAEVVKLPFYKRPR